MRRCKNFEGTNRYLYVCVVYYFVRVFMKLYIDPKL